MSNVAEGSAMPSPQPAPAAAASPINEIRTIESDGQHFIDLWLDGHEMQRRGPFASHEIAEAMAARLAAACGCLFGKLMEIRHG